jgi:hypothetical protein
MLRLWPVEMWSHVVRQKIFVFQRNVQGRISEKPFPHTEYVGSRLLQNFTNHLWNYKASHPRQLCSFKSSVSLTNPSNVVLNTYHPFLLSYSSNISVWYRKPILNVRFVYKGTNLFLCSMRPWCALGMWNIAFSDFINMNNFKCVSTVICN